jgi:hypothetical protein
MKAYSEMGNKEKALVYHKLALAKLEHLIYPMKKLEHCTILQRMRQEQIHC